MKHLLASALVAATFFAVPAMAEAVKINAVTLAPRQAYITNPFKMFVEEVNDKFAGEVEITWRGGPEVMPPFKQAEGVRNGAMDMTYTSPSYYQGLVPTSGTMNLSFKNYDEIAATDYHERMTELHAEKDLILLGEIPASQLNFLIYMGGEVSGLDDLKGKRIRVFPTLLPLVKALGAEPIVLPMGEIFTAMERGAIDGFMQGPVGQAQQFEGLVKTVIYPGVYRAGFPVLVNKDTWNEMSPDLQQRLTTFLREDFAPRMDNIWAETIAENQKAMDDAGFNRMSLSDEEAARYEQIAMDAAWAVTAENAGAEAAAELRSMLDK
ncbi:TRAP transporter substrate-binding protein DctP [Hoeflea prorocentri]|uniref:TRAP transporter substrate-binding protein DctP n=1 Tax=Hoeflea prorocentri TaxID=1922333 RepID=A0A9X3UJA3_9HYPH|nr:TRAP transporter substrate-binding protein DctP [Hoeflea prorocentri]MCY6379761.1 TRAP transporter substrate-binding protein DctP [Hoeflea prorocentri]MDA5397561.1 TRAP transporter substrate-binding protein DctP [Hoeflea prorocentri]